MNLQEKQQEYKQQQQQATASVENVISIGGSSLIKKRRETIRNALEIVREITHDSNPSQDDHDERGIRLFDAVEKCQKLGIVVSHDLTNLRQELTHQRDQLETQAGDTAFNSTMDDYRAVVERLGFEKVAEFNYDSAYAEADEKLTETFNVYARPDGLILSFASALETDRDAASLYFQWASNDQEKIGPPIGFSGSYQEVGKDTYAATGHTDARESLCETLEKLEKKGRFFTPWVQGNKRDVKFALLSSHDRNALQDKFNLEHHERNRNAEKELIQERFEALPQWVREMTGFKKL